MKKSSGTGGKRVTGSGRSGSKSKFATQKPTQSRNTTRSSKPKGGAKGGGRKTR